MISDPFEALWLIISSQYGPLQNAAVILLKTSLEINIWTTDEKKLSLLV